MTSGLTKRLQQPPVTRASLCADLQHAISETIPLARAMQLRVKDGLMLKAPLHPNINDKGKARITLAPKILDVQGRETVTFPSEYIALNRDRP
jgi:hypothetical protein